MSEYTDAEMERIYLQIDDHPHGETTWCIDRQNDDDVEYIRIDKVVEVLESINSELLERIKVAAQSYVIGRLAYCRAGIVSAAKELDIELKEVEPGHKYVEKIQEAQRKTREISTHLGKPDVKEVE